MLKLNIININTAEYQFLPIRWGPYKNFLRPDFAPRPPIDDLTHSILSEEYKHLNAVTYKQLFAMMLSSQAIQPFLRILPPLTSCLFLIGGMCNR